MRDIYDFIVASIIRQPVLGALFPSAPSRQNPGYFYSLLFFFFNLFVLGASRLDEAETERWCLILHLPLFVPKSSRCSFFADFGPFCCGAIIAVVLPHNNLFKIYIPEATACLCLPPFGACYVR